MFVIFRSQRSCLSMLRVWRSGCLSTPRQAPPPAREGSFSSGTVLQEGPHGWRLFTATFKGSFQVCGNANTLNFQLYLLEGLCRWNQDQEAASLTRKPSSLLTYAGEMVHCLNSLKVFGRKSIPSFQSPAKYTGKTPYNIIVIILININNNI